MTKRLPFRRSRETAPRALEELLSEHLDALYRTALRFCGGRKADAEDLLPDAMLRAFGRFGELRELGEPRLRQSGKNPAPYTEWLVFGRIRPGGRNDQLSSP